MRYLELLSRLFPSADKASAEIINLSAILNLPKGTEFFASDIHGEYEAFSHTQTTWARRSRRSLPRS